MNDIVDQELVSSVMTHLKNNYEKDEKYVAAVIKTADGQEFKAMHTRHYANKMCAELAAMIVMINTNNDIKQPITSIAATFDRDGHAPKIINSCGRCRQVLGDTFSSVRFIVNDSGSLINISIDEALPYTYQRNEVTA